MSKVLNAVFGIGIAVIIYIVALLGIDAFYPEVNYNDFCNESIREEDPFMEFAKCPDNITVGECRESMTFNNTELIKCEQEFNIIEKNYNQNFFIIASILGTIILFSAFFFLNTTNISAGIASSAILLITWAFIRGWESTSSLTKFMIALIIAIIIITLTINVNKKLENNFKKKKKT